MGSMTSGKDVQAIVTNLVSRLNAKNTNRRVRCGQSLDRIVLCTSTPVRIVDVNMHEFLHHLLLQTIVEP